jgi:hypothetical protein
MDLKKLAQAALKTNPGAEKIFATTDGNTFISKNHANLHANTNRTGKKMKVTTFTANELKGKSIAEIAADAKAKAKKSAELKAKKEADLKAKAEKSAELKAKKEADAKAKAEKSAEGTKTK